MTRKRLEHSEYDRELPTSRAQEHLSKLERRSLRRKSLWNGHVAGFVSINAFLIFIDSLTAGGPWVPFVIGAMAIPLVAHGIFKRRRDRLQAKLGDLIERNPAVPDRMFRPFLKLHRSTSRFLLSLGSGAIISAYMFLIDLLVGGRPFAGIVAGSIALPVVFHGLLWRGRQRALREQLESGGDRPDEPHAPGKKMTDTSLPGAEHPSLREARAIESEIRKRVESHAETPDDVVLGVHALVAEVESLCELSVDFSRALNAIPKDELERDRITLLERREENGDKTLSLQYSDALKQVERQLAALAELENRRELLELRIRTGVNSLRQINVDLVRMQGDAAMSKITSMVQERTNELSGYLSDLQESYRELSEEFGSL